MLDKITSTDEQLSNIDQQLSSIDGHSKDLEEQLFEIKQLKNVRINYLGSLLEAFREFLDDLDNTIEEKADWEETYKNLEEFYSSNFQDQGK